MRRPDQPRQAPASANFDPVAEIYDDTRDRLSDAELSALSKELQGSKTLEIAVGTGRLAKPLQDQGIDITGIDISTRMLERAKAKGTKSLVRGEVTNLPFKPGSFDTVLTVHFLHLIPDWPGLIQEVARVATHRLVGLDTKTTSVSAGPDSGINWEGIHDLYLGWLSTRGFQAPIRPHGELRLGEKVKPYKKDVVEKVTRTTTLDKALDMLEKKYWAVTWAVPDNLHREVVTDLRKELSGRVLDVTYESILLVWEVKDLARAEPYL